MLQQTDRGVFGAANRTTAAATVGLAFGPSTALVFSFGVFIEPLNKAFGWSHASIAFASTLVAIMTMLVSPLQGYLIDRYGSRRVVLTSIPFFAAGLFAASQMSGDIRLFYLLYALLPLLGLGIWSGSYLRGVSTWYERHLGLAIGVANGGIGIGAAVFPIIATALMADGHWQRGYTSIALIALLVTWPLNYLFFQEAPKASVAVGAVGHGMPGDMTFGEIVRTRSFRLLLVAFITLGFVNVGLIVNQVPLLIDGGVNPGRAATAQATLGLSILFGRFLCGILLDRVPAALLMCFVCLGGMLACLLYASGVSGIALLISPILIGGVIGAEFDVLSYMIKKYFGIASFGRANGVIFSIFQLGAAIGATVLPLSRSNLGSYTPGLLAFAAALLVSAACFAVLRPTAFARRQVPSAAVAS